MAAEARYNDAKEKWLQAASQARTAKDTAKADYNAEKEDRLTDATFDQWWPQNVRSLIICKSILGGQQMIPMEPFSTNLPQSPSFAVALASFSVGGCWISTCV